jgi:DNA repair protein RadC
MRIKDISQNNRPRERLQKEGVEVLSDAELLAIILQKGTRTENVIDMSNRLISRYGLDKLSDCSLTELQKIKGIGPAKACQIQALFELNSRYNNTKKTIKKIKSAKDVYDYTYEKLKNLKKEHFVVLCLDSKNNIIKDSRISVGTLNEAIVHPREVFKEAIRESANSIILVHNHPSGNCEPSTHDKEITKSLIEAGKILRISVLDHVIIGRNEYYSFKENKI